MRKCAGLAPATGNVDPRLAGLMPQGGAQAFARMGSSMGWYRTAAFAGLRARYGFFEAFGFLLDDDPVAEMVRLKDALCACEDMGCAQDVSKELEALGARFEGTKISDEQGEVASAAAGEIADCLTRLVGASEDERHSPPTM